MSRRVESCPWIERDLVEAVELDPANQSSYDETTALIGEVGSVEGEGVVGHLVLVLVVQGLDEDFLLHSRGDLVEEEGDLHTEVAVVVELVHLHDCLVDHLVDNQIGKVVVRPSFVEVAVEGEVDEEDTVLHTWELAMVEDMDCIVHSIEGWEGLRV